MIEENSQKMANIERVRQATTFEELVANESPLSNWKETVKERNLASALDLGCGPGIPLWTFYHNFGFQKLVGVDIKSETEIMEWKQQELPEIHRSKDFFEYYSNNLFNDPTDIKPKIEFRKEFYETFSYRFEMPMKKYLDGCREKFDIIICCNSLHYADNRAFLARQLNQINLIANERALIYIRLKEKPGEIVYREFAFEEYEEMILKAMPSLDLVKFDNLVTKTILDEGRSITFTNIPL